MRLDIKFFHIGLASLLIVFAVIAPLMYLDTGLSTDESYFMVVGDSILSGKIPYKDIIDIKPPGIHYLAAGIFTIFGQSYHAARFSVYMVNVASAILLYYITQKYWNKETGALASTLFLIGLLNPYYEGYYFLTEPFMVFFGLAAVGCFFTAAKWSHFLIVGVLIGIATLFKQTGIFFLFIFGVYYLTTLRKKQNRNADYIRRAATKIVIIIMGCSIPLAVVLFYFFSIGALEGFIQWPVQFIIKDYGSYFDKGLIKGQFYSFSAVWIPACFGLALLISKSIKKNLKEFDIFIIIWLCVMLYSHTARQYGHYVIQYLPQISILASIGLIKIIKRLTKRIPKKVSGKLLRDLTIRLFIAFIITITVLSTCQYLKDSTSLYERRLNSLDIQFAVGSYIHNHTVAGDSIYSFNAVQIYYTANRQPAVNILSKWNGVFSAKESYVIRELQGKKTPYVVIQNDYLVDGISVYNHSTIYQFIFDYYELECTINQYDIYHRTEGI